MYRYAWCILIITRIFIFGIHYGRAAGMSTESCSGEVGEILHDIRSLMANAEFLEIENVIEAYIVPSTDAHQNEYVAEHDKRLQYITKFTGSAGEAVVTMTNAVMWTDSRYFLQAEEQLGLSCWTLMKQGSPNVQNISQWLNSNLPKNSSVGVDPFVKTSTDFRRIQGELDKSGQKLVGTKKNLVDAIWKGRPALSRSPIYPIGLQYTGKSSGIKLLEVDEKLKNVNAETIIITKLDDIAWLLNLRGSDIMYSPLFFSYVIHSSVKTVLFVEDAKLTENSRKQLEAENVKILVRNYKEIVVAIEEVVNTTNGNIILPSSASEAVFQLIPADRRIEKNLVSELKSIKNVVEGKNMELAHIRDGLALIQYLHWLNTTIDNENITEIDGATKLSNFRRQQNKFRDLSFEVISAVGEHAAMAHYSPTIETSKQISRSEIYLVDSGAQYWDGTTDVTRTVHFGTPTNEEKECYTLVLKGFIAIVTSVFPKQTPLSYFDNIARRPLWQKGLDYGHGTGHGVGMFLSVHEYPPLINSKATDILYENVFTSNEPGFYKEGAFGIRIEDVIQVVKSNNENAFDGQGALTFKSITYAPLHLNLIDTDLLSKEEIHYVNTYNEKVQNTIGPILLKRKLMDTYQWLLMETQPIE